MNEQLISKISHTNIMEIVSLTRVGYNIDYVIGYLIKKVSNKLKFGLKISKHS